jgi:hypothetical protein
MSYGTDNTETVATFDHDGKTYEIDHLGILYPSQAGEYAVYCEGRQLTTFVPEDDGPSDAQLIAEAKIALADPR